MIAPGRMGVLVTAHGNNPHAWLTSIWICSFRDPLSTMLSGGVRFARIIYFRWYEYGKFLKHPSAGNLRE